jgi:signal transduction histidine kinase
VLIGKRHAQFSFSPISLKRVKFGASIPVSGLQKMPSTQDEARVIDALHALLLIQLQRSLWVNVPVVAITAITTAVYLPHSWALIWSMVLVLILILRAGSIRCGYQSVPALVFGAAVFGIAWALLFWIAPGIVPEPLRLFYALVLSGMTASALVSLGADLRVYFAFAVPCWIGTALANGLAGGLGFAVAAVALAFGMTLCAYAPVLRRRLIESIALGFANADLVSELTEQRNAAVVQREQRTRFLAVASHDLRQPAHAIGLITHYLQQLSVRSEPTDSAAWAIGLDRLNAGVGSLNQHLDDLLDLTRLQLGHAQPERRAVALHALMARVQARFALDAEKRGLRLRMRVAGDIWVRSHTLLLERMLSNLVSNALRYTERGGVLIAARMVQAQVQIRVIDTGIGIAQADQNRIYDEFVQVNAVQHEKGLGLGLAIVAQLARELSHPLTLKSVLGRGSCFSLQLLPMPKPIQTEQHAKRSTDLISAQSTQRALILDDNAQVRDALVSVLQQLGWLTSAHGSLSSARDVVFEFAPTLLLLDVHMASLDGGLIALKALRHELDAVVPALLITGDLIEALDVQPEANIQWLRKPVSAEVILHAVAELKIA